MKNLKGYQKILIAVCAILLVVIGYAINFAINKLFNEETEVETVETGNKCSEAKLYYSLDDYDIYTYCLDSIKISRDKEFVELSSLFESDTTIKDLFRNMKEKEVYKDGGSKLYIDTKQDIGLIKCNTIDGNRDIYIGNKDIKYEKNFCKTSLAEFPLVTESEFQEDYEIHAIIDANSEEYKHITIKIPNTDYVETVRVETKLLNNVKPNNGIYTFKFKTDKTPFRSDIKSVFEHATVESIKLLEN